MKTVSQNIVELLLANSMKVSFAESCTGGMITSAITQVSGSSAVLDMSIVTYSNESKVKYTHVTDEILEAHGAVSEATALHMATGIRERSGADIGVGITGIAGPTGGSEAKPVGTVFIAVVSGKANKVERFLFTGERETVRQQATQKALEVLYDFSLQQTSFYKKSRSYPRET